jgi:predicted ATPase
MIKEIRYKNFKALRDTTLPLGQFTLIVGANGTGKTTAMKVLKDIESLIPMNYDNFVTKGLEAMNTPVEIEIAWENFRIKRVVNQLSVSHFFTKGNSQAIEVLNNPSFSTVLISAFSKKEESIEFKSFKLFSFNANQIKQPTSLSTNLELALDGENLAGILDQLRDIEPERFESLNRELNKWFPEYDRILFEVPNNGYRAFLLRTKIGQHKIKAEDLSDGTRLALAYLTIAYLPNPPKIVCFEEPERGIHPRLLRNIQEAMYRLAFPANYGENREPIQVVATTHSPYLLDLYKDNPEEIVIANKDEKGVHFENLSKMKNIDKILQDGESLGEVWFTGILGGVPTHV